MTAHHTKTIIVDFDDTLAFTKTRDWENALPNTLLINRLNKLYDEGWDIHVVTARGQISCNGDSVAADEKYRRQITGWLNKHSVKYTSLSFQKKLGAYYIDDKGCTPEQFLENFHDRVPLSGGWSGATVEYDALSRSVYKTAPNALQASAWYEHAKNEGLANFIPKIHTVIGDTIKMSYIDGIPFSSQSVTLGVELALRFKNVNPLYSSSVGYTSYVDRCMNRGNGLFSDTVLTNIKNALYSAHEYTPYTFSHGDFSINNLIETRDNLVMIDPLSAPDLYSSYVIDLGKLYGSAELCSQGLSSKILYTTCLTCQVIPPWGLIAHGVGHMLRMLPYAPPDKKQILISKIIELNSKL